MRPPRSGRRRAVQVRLGVWVGLVVTTLVGMPVWFWLLRGGRLADTASQPLLYGGWAGFGALSLLTLWLVRTTPPDAWRLSSRAGFWCVVLGAGWLQGWAVAWLVPSLSDDAVRYRLDGAMWLVGRSPYVTPPATAWKAGAGEAPPDRDEPFRGGAWTDEAFTPDAIDRFVSFPDFPTIYLPTSQVLFAAVRAVEYTTLGEPPPASDDRWREAAGGWAWAYRLTYWRITFAALMVAATGLLASAATRRGISPWAAAVLGWSPLTVLETGGMGHQDAVGVLLIATALRSLGRVQFTRSGLAWGAAVLVKPLAVLPLAFVFRSAGGRRASRVRRLAIGLVVPLTVGVVLLAYQQGFLGLQKTLGAYLTRWEANGATFVLMSRVVEASGVEDPATLTRGLAGLAVVIVGTVLWRRGVGPVGAGYALTLTTLLLSPVVYPWYLLWALAYVPLLRRGGWTLLTWAATVVLSYRLLHEPTWSLPTSWLVAEYVPVLIVGIWEVTREVCRPAAVGYTKAPPVTG